MWRRVNRSADASLRQYHGESVMVSMGSLGHYMQDLSRHGFRLRDFLHEGNGDVWLNALEDPRPFAGWMLIEEKAEGGDMLAKRARENPAFLTGFSRVCEGGRISALSSQSARGPRGCEPPLEPHVKRREIRPPAEFDMVRREFF